MGKIISLMRASMSEGMNVFRLSGKKQSKITRIGFPLLMAVFCAFSVAIYAEMTLDFLAGTGMDFVMLTLFVLFAAGFTLIEGIYKASGLLFNCKDDDILLSLPIKKTTVLMTRVAKFYLFEVMVNTLILAPAMIVYGVKTGQPGLFYLISGLAVMILPILPVAISCLIGGVISYFSAKFKFKNIIQTVLTFLLLIGVLYLSFNLGDVIKIIAENAASINELITRLYYPAGGYIGLVLDFKIWDLMMFLIINLAIMALVVGILGKVYYKINSQTKIVKNNVQKRTYKIKTNRPLVALIKKEIGRFVSSPVFTINAGFGLVLFLIIVVLLCVNTDWIMGAMGEMGIELSQERVLEFMPAVLFGVIFFISMTTTITCSMISLEGRAFNVLKSLPVNAMTIIIAKVLAAVVIIVPLLLAGDLLMFLKFDFSIWQMLLIVLASVIIPMMSETMGIIINLKYPKMDAKDDTEVVKQSMSSMVAVFMGMGISLMMIFIIIKLFLGGTSATEVLEAGVAFGGIILVSLVVYLKKKGVQEFNAINV